MSGAEEYFQRVLLHAGPSCLLWLIGIIWSVARWNRHASVSRLVVIACALFILNRLGGAYVIYRILSQPEDIQDYERVSARVDRVFWIQTALHFGSWILILVAIFSWRATKRLRLDDDLEASAEKPIRLSAGETDSEFPQTGIRPSTGRQVRDDTP